MALGEQITNITNITNIGIIGNMSRASGTGIDILIDKIKIACYLLLHAKKSQN